MGEVVASGWSWLGQHFLVLLVGLVALAVGLSAYLLLVGTWLNRRFRRETGRLAAGETAVLAGALDRLATVFGWHLMLLLLLGYLLLFLVVLPALGVLAIAVSAWFDPRPNYFLSVPFALIGAGAVGGLLRGLVIRHPERFALPLPREAEPAIWALSDEVAAAVGTRSADRIVVTLTPTIGVSTHGQPLDFLRGRGRRELMLGAPALLGLRVDELRTVLAHEYAHFARRDTIWLRATVRARVAIHEAIEELHANFIIEDAIPAWLRLLDAINPGRWLLIGYAHLFERFTSAFSRLQEVMADATALRLYGAAPFRRSQEQMLLVDRLFGRHVMAEAYTAVQANRPPPEVLAGLAERLAALTPAARTATIQRGLAEQRPTPLDSHPSTAARLAHAGHYPDGEAEPAPWPSLSLLATWPAVAAALEEHLQEQLAAAMYGKARWIW